MFDWVFESRSRQLPARTYDNRPQNFIYIDDIDIAMAERQDFYVRAQLSENAPKPNLNYLGGNRIL